MTNPKYRVRIGARDRRGTLGLGLVGLRGGLFRLLGRRLVMADTLYDFVNGQRVEAQAFFVLAFRFVRHIYSSLPHGSCAGAIISGL
jgi:hypothetical protein